MLEAFENVIIRKIMGEEVDYKPSKLNNHKISVYLYDDHISINCDSDVQEQVSEHLIEWGWKYHAKHSPSPYSTMVKFTVDKKIPNHIKVTDTMFINNGNVIITDNIQKIHQKLDGTKFEHVEYNAPAYALCGASWTIRYENTIIVLDHALCSGGHVSWGEQDIIESGPWSLRLPDFLEPYKEQLTKLANENIPQGCCGGCI